VAARRPFIPCRRDLKRRSQSLRRDPSPAERKLWFEFLRDLPVKFTRQKPLGRYIADFYCASQQLVIEVDGDSHFDDKGARYDSARTATLEFQGVRVIRVTNLEVMEQFEGVCQRIRDALARSL
jgi:very-short-patch-repair endonuclease